MHSNVTSKIVVGFTLRGAPCRPTAKRTSPSFSRKRSGYGRTKPAMSLKWLKIEWS